MISSAPLPTAADVVVVGAGLAGLSCARYLVAGGASVHVVEAADTVGGRVRTDEVEGFRLDRGFQVLLTAYDEVWRLVDRESLHLGAFLPGSLVRSHGAFHRLADPFRSPGSLPAALRAPVGGWGDKLRVARLRAELVAGGEAPMAEGPVRSTLAELRERGFGEDFIDAFFRPFLSGVFLDRSLATPAALFRYLFRCFAVGDATLPAGGMGRLPARIAAPLDGSITLGARVTAVAADAVSLADGRTVRAGRVVVATDAHDAAALTGGEAPAFTRALTAWFAAREAPVDDPILVLDGEGRGPVNHLAVVSRVAEGLAPDGWSLVAVSGVAPTSGPAEGFAKRAAARLREWFGEPVDGWRHLRTDDISRALPRRSAAVPLRPRPLSSGGVYIAGDDREFAAIQGALRSGRTVAEAILTGA